ncbi:MAG TPA: hypothetical protein VFL41_12155 [Gaiellaceae bacterium]|nr:hypothetical protein [Gaiellaceae bacterium]HET8652548.1 hypothetical protein [Gaiellaceae bacterium]
MSIDKALRCDCGYRLRARTEQRQAAEVLRHAWEAHGISFSTEEALAVLLRLELEEGAWRTSPWVEDTARRKEAGMRVLTR